jgi:hypothetical protein
VRLLLEAGADKHANSTFGSGMIPRYKSVLTHARTRGHEEIIALLTANDAASNSEDGSDDGNDEEDDGADVAEGGSTSLDVLQVDLTADEVTELGPKVLHCW